MTKGAKLLEKEVINKNTGGHRKYFKKKIFIPDIFQTWTTVREQQPYLEFLTPLGNSRILSSHQSSRMTKLNIITKELKDIYMHI